MAISIMDGHTGTAHVTSDDWSAFNQATYGALNAVLNFGNDFGLTLTGNSAGTVGTGAGLVNGRRFRITTPEAVSFAAGSQGMRRWDAVTVAYSATTAGVESVAIKVVKGTPAATASKPDVDDDALVLWYVPFDGINVGTPERGAQPLPTLAGGDYVAEASTVSGWFVRKWASGRMDKRRRLTIPAGQWQAWGGVVESTTSAGNIAYAGAAFAETPSVRCEFVSHDAGESAISIAGFSFNGGTSTTCPTVRALRGGSATGMGGPVVFDLVAEGRWK